MKNIALTMRADVFGQYKEERDSIDPRWFKFLKNLILEYYYCQMNYM